MNRDKQSLPIFKEKDAIIDSVRKNPVTIIVGDHGLREEHAGATVPDRCRLEPHRVHAAAAPVDGVAERARGEGDVLRGDGGREV